MVSIYLKQFLDDSFEKVKVKGDKSRFRDQIYIDDVVNITIESMVNNAFDNKIINMGIGKKTTVDKILNLIKKYTGSHKKIAFVKETPRDKFGIYSYNKRLLSMYGKTLTSFKMV